MKRSTATGKNGKLVIIIFTCACRILYGSFNFKVSDWLARVGQCASVLRNMPLKNGFKHVLLDHLL